MLFLFPCEGLVFHTLHKRSFAELFKNLARCRSLEIILFDHRNNYVECLFAAKTFWQPVWAFYIIILTIQTKCKSVFS